MSAPRLVVAALVILLAGGCRQQYVLEIHRAEHEQRAGLTPVQDRWGSTYYMSPEIELTEADVRRVEFVPDENGAPRIKLLFNESGAAKFRSLTKAHTKRPLVFLVRGKVAMIPVVTDGAKEDFTWIQGFVTEDDAKVLSSSLK